MTTITKMPFAALVAAGLMFSPITTAPARAGSVALTLPDADVMDQTVEQLMSVIRSAKKPLPAWALEMALRAYDVWQTYRNGQKVQEVQATVISVLKVVDDIRVQVEQGREFSEREYRLTRELLDAHGARLSDLTTRIENIERAFFARTCGTGRARRNGKCVDVASNPRR